MTSYSGGEAPPGASPLDRLLWLLSEIEKALQPLMSENIRLKDQLAQAKPDNRPKLSAREVAQIRAMRRAGHGVRELARVFDVNHSTVSRLCKGQIHK